MHRTENFVVLRFFRLQSNINKSEQPSHHKLFNNSIVRFATLINNEMPPSTMQDFLIIIMFTLGYCNFCDQIIPGTKSTVEMYTLQQQCCCHQA